MLYGAVGLFILTVISAVCGFTQIDTAEATVAKVLFGIFLVLFFVCLVFGLRRHEHA